MFARVAVLLFAGCAVVLARPQDFSTFQQAQQYQNWLLQQLNPNAQQQAFNRLQGLQNSNPLQGLNQNPLQGLNQNPLQGLNQNPFQGLNQNPFEGLQNSNPLQGLNQNPLQGLQNSNPLQGLNQNPLQGLNPNLLQGLNQNQLQALLSSQLQRPNPNQLQALLSGQLQGLNQNQPPAQIPGQLQGHNPNQLLGYTNQLQNLLPGLNNGFNGYNNAGSNSKYQTPLLELPNHAIDWGQNVIDGGVSRVGSALSQAFENTERVAQNAIDTIGEVGRRGFQDGSALVKSGLGIFTAFPKIGLGLLSRQNNNNGYGY